MHQMQLLAIWWHMEITSKLFLNGNSFLLQQYCIIIFVTFCTACNFIIFLHCFHVKSGLTLYHVIFGGGEPCSGHFSTSRLWSRTVCLDCSGTSPDTSGGSETLWYIYIYTHTHTHTHICILTNSVWFSVSRGHKILALCPVTHTGKKILTSHLYNFSKYQELEKLNTKYATLCNPIALQHYLPLYIGQFYCWGDSTTESLTKPNMAAPIILNNKTLVAYLGEINVSDSYMEMPNGQ